VLRLPQLFNDFFQVINLVLLLIVQSFQLVVFVGESDAFFEEFDVWFTGADILIVGIFIIGLDEVVEVDARSRSTARR
jgi:hypothetical protein